MKIKSFLSVILSGLLICGACFANDFDVVGDAGETTLDINMENMNKNDTYQAQKEAESAEIKRLEREASRLSEKMKSGTETKKEVKKETPPKNKLHAAYLKFIKDPRVVRVWNTIKSLWEKFKRWFVTLPVIRHWLASPYSMDNFKKEMGLSSDEHAKHLKKDSAGIKMLKDGSKQFFK
ncbi:MAG: hypothetical protein FWG57_06825 [Endomicrobia bacterium]|nr:hypothetical protein [Bacillota bacterium]MCL1972681.1 hypothetical protein [Endomicrobiia bacterium]